MPSVLGYVVLGGAAATGVVGLRIASRFSYLWMYCNPDRSQSLSDVEKKKQQDLVAKMWKGVDNEMYHKNSNEWWDLTSPFSSGLHAMTKMRAPYFLEHATKSLNWSTKQKKEQDLNILDVGCGGGILAEALVRSAIDTHQYKKVKLQGIDLAEGAIKVAQEHSKQFCASLPNGTGDCDVTFEYKQADACSLCDVIPESSIDVVVAADVLEHVLDAEGVVNNVSRVLKPGGVFVFDTINRTLASYITSIFLAQELPFGLSVLPSHTHEWGMFIKPTELQSLCEANQMKIFALNGFRPSLDSNLLRAILNRSKFHQTNFVETNNLSSQYIGCAQKLK